MHKDFYASGFLFHPPTRQILLQQQKSNSETSSPWSMFEAKNLPKKSAEQTFQHFIHKLLHVRIRLDSIYLAYTYFCKDVKKNRFIVYAELKKTKDFSSKKVKFGWFTFKQVIKLKLDNQAKHDIVVAERVIASKIRKSLGQQTLE